VAVVGAAGGIGQPLSLLLKLNPRVKSLNLYDLAPVTPGVACDLSHINTPAKVTGFTGAENLGKALEGVDVIVIPAGVPRKPGMTRDDLFNINAGIVAEIAKTAAKVAPKALHLIISNPVNSTVPIVAEVLKRAGVYDKRRVFGVTTLDVVRANTFVAENQKADVAKVNVPVVGGHAGITILPLLSQVAGAKFSADDQKNLTQRIAFGGDEVVKAKAGAGSATLSMAQAGAQFTDLVLRALTGEKNIVACTYVESDVQKPLRWFSSPVVLGKDGVAEIRGIGKLDAFEQEKL
jgi:malate dehydrogenase